MDGINGLPFFMACNGIILIVTTITAICTLINLFKKPAKKYKEKQDNELKTKISDVLTEVLPGILKAHDLETRDRYKSDRQNYLNDITNEVISRTHDEFNQLKILKLQYESLIISTKDVLREKIIAVYTNNREKRELTILEKEKLDQFYKDYKALNGNSYIDKYYNRMCKWTIIMDDDDNDDVI